MSWGTNFVVKIILSHVEPRVLLSITTLAEFLKDVAQFNLYRCLDIKERFFLISLWFGQLNFQELQ